MIKAEEKDINIREYSEMVDRLVEHYLGAIENPDTALFIVEEYVHGMSTDEMKQAIQGLQDADNH
tara:strand:- start:607 stop:801 length:195 start_codon:yes stop_codon:yes gene_type:complete